MQSEVGTRNMLKLLLYNLERQLLNPDIWTVDEEPAESKWKLVFAFRISDQSVFKLNLTT